jgi:hypothetical protein|tara:strand:+ start:613 stop:1056 length:444 start_codon:yes stop_codon:yes gene_type:complete
MVQSSSIEKVLHNLQFDRLFLDRIKEVERSKRKRLHGNGVPFQHICVFKVLLCMLEKDMDTNKISENYRSLFGIGVNQSSLSRILTYLCNELGIVEYASNPHNVDARFTYVKLSKKGKEFQRHLIGSTNVYQPNVKEFRNIVNIKTG